MSNNRIESTALRALQFKALSNPVRLRLFEELTRCCEVGSLCDMQRCVGDLAHVVDIAPSTLSHHLKVLHQAGLIEMQRAGKNMMCRVDAKVIQTLSNYFKELPIKELS